MIYLKLLFLILFAYLLSRDFILTRGMFIKAKIFHSLAVLFVFYYYSSGFTGIVWLIKNINHIDSFYNENYGIFSGTYFKINSIVLTGFSAIAATTAFGLTGRNHLSRKIILNIIPFLILTSIPYLYKGFKAKATFINDFYSLLICFIIAIILNGWVYIIYKSKFMNEFFDNKLNK